jgi:hypothetical protein
MKTERLLIAAILLATLAGCSLYRNDRAYIWDSEYQKMRDLYDQCGSVAVIEEVLRDHRWTRAQINEVRYRLAQDYSLDEKGMPRGIDRERPVVKTQPRAKLGAGSSRGMSQPVTSPVYY